MMSPSAESNNIFLKVIKAKLTLPFKKPKNQKAVIAIKINFLAFQTDGLVGHSISTEFWLFLPDSVP